MSGKTHPAEVTAERLAKHYEKWFDRLTDQERAAIGDARAALARIADEAASGVSTVHLDRGDDRPRCGNPQAREVTAGRGQVTCPTCLNLAEGTHGVGVHWYDVKPCGTPAAYRRHLRRQGKPVRCETCLQAERRRVADRKARELDAGNYRRAA